MVVGLTARGAAVELLNAVLVEKRLLSQVADDQGLLAPLSGPERARALRLALAVLRRIELADRILAPLLRKAPPPGVLNILRLAVVEMAEGTAPHGVVNTSVTMVRQNKRTTHLAGLVNAVLRQVPAVPLSGPAQHLQRWLRQPLVHAWGREAVSAIEAVQATVPPLDLTHRAGTTAPMAETLPTGSLRLRDAGQISGLPGYDAGGWWVQDAAAALAVPLLGNVSGQRVLDLCAAPGGKTMQLAAAGARVTALDISDTRMERLRQNLVRCGLAADIVAADALTWQPESNFDAILLDAPCSATGTIRRHPDLPFVKDGTEIPGLVALQSALIDRALSWLVPGGRLVYCTCSLLPEEGEKQWSDALGRHPDLRTIPPTLPWVESAWITSQGGLRLRPDYWAERGGMDGFFMACGTR